MTQKIFIVATFFALFIGVNSSIADITGKIINPLSGSKVFALRSDGSSETADVSARGNFTINVDDAARLLVLVGGSVDGPIYLYTNAKSVTNLSKGKSCSSVVTKAKVFARATLANSRKILKLGNIKRHSSGFYYPTKQLTSKNIDRETQFSINANCTPDAATGDSLGFPTVGSSRRDSIHSFIKTSADDDDNDDDGLADALDVDDDDDGVLDSYDSSSGSGSTANTFRLFSNLKVNIEDSLNVNAGTTVTDELISDLVQDHATLAIAVAGSVSDTTELDCGANTTTGLSYCASGGTGTAVNSRDRFPDDSDSDADGRGEIVRGGTGDFQLSPHASAEDIQAGDTFVEFVTDSSNNVTEYSSMLNFIFNTTPAIKSVVVGSSTTNISYPVTSGSFGTSSNCILVPTSGTVTVSLTGWRPQRKGISSAGEAEYVDIGNSLITIDIPNAPCTLSGGGGCQGTGPGNCSNASYSTSDTNLATSISNQGLQDSSGDRDADAANTYTFTVNLSTCLGSTTWNAGESLFLDLQFRSRDGDNAAQKFCVKRATS